MSIPKTRLSTRMSGSASETEQRLRNLFAQHRRPALALVITVGLVIGLCGSLVACRTGAVEDEARLKGLYDDGGIYLEKELLAGVDGPGSTLVAGHYSDDSLRCTLAIGVEDVQGRLMGPVFATSTTGGRPQVSAFRKDGVDYLLYTVNGGSQGITYGEAGLIAFDGTDFTWVWPVEGDLRQQDSQAWADYQAYWADRMALMCPGGVELFRQSEKFAPMTSGDKQWYFSEYIRFTQEETAVPDARMEELRQILEDRTRDGDNPWQANNTSAQWQIAQVTPGEETLCGQRYTLLASSAWSDADWLGMEVLLQAEGRGCHSVLRVVTGTAEAVKAAMGETNRQKKVETLSMTTASGRELSVELELEPLDQKPDSFVVEQIKVYEEERLLQTIGAGDVSYHGDDPFDGLFVLRGYEAGEPDLRDLNADGSPDLGLLAVCQLPPNAPYGWFLWDEAAGGFVFSDVRFVE